MTKAVLVLDCGATNVKACLVDPKGCVLSSYSLPNEVCADPLFPDGLIWDVDKIWDNLSECSRKACSDVKGTEIVALTVTTFGVDGAAMKNNGQLCYPAISWQCSRTEEIEKKRSEYINPEKLHRITGLKSYHFNTINKLIWLKENFPGILDEMDHYVLFPSIFLHKITGKFITDITMAGTTMLTDIKNRSFSDEIMECLGLSPTVFPPLLEPGSFVGETTSQAAQALGIPAGVPVVTGGHDTQFAIIGSGADIHQPVLSSGTWEILMTRSYSSSIKLPEISSGITVEMDVQPGIADIGTQWVASGVLERIAGLFYSELSGSPELYPVMINEATAVSAGSDNVTVIPEFFPGEYLHNEGMIRGLTHETTRAHVYRASLEALSYYTRYGLEQLMQVGNFKISDVLCVGGGSKNTLWNQIRADVLRKPVKVTDTKEITAVGAAMVAFTALGEYTSVKEAFSSQTGNYRLFEPGKDQDVYEEYYHSFLHSIKQLQK